MQSKSRAALSTLDNENLCLVGASASGILCAGDSRREMTLKLLRAALATKDRFHISYWDAAIVEAARQMGCYTILPEDLNHGQDYGGVKAINPFRGPRPRG